MRNLAIGDLHLRWERPGYFQFCSDLYEEYDCDSVTFMGDVVESHGVSFHMRHPDMPGSKLEYEMTKEAVARWYKRFPKAVVTIGNHDERLIRLASTVGISESRLPSFEEDWGTPGWDWKWDHVIDDVYYYHGTGQGGTYPACNAVRKMLMSCVLGHNHSASGIKWYANPKRRIFACDTGCGIDDKSMAFAYNKHNKQRSILSAAVIIDGVPYLEPMPCGRGEQYHDSNF